MPSLALRGGIIFSILLTGEYLHNHLFQLEALPLVFGYLDPGSGGILLYVLTGMLVSIGFSLKRMWFRFLSVIMIFGRPENFKGGLEAQIILHSEGPQYETLFLPLVKELHQRELDFIFVTQYKRDDTSEPLPEGVNHVELSDGLAGFAVLNRAEAELFLTTTPQLDVLMLKRSPNVKLYSNVFHAAGNLRSLEMFSLDYFDTVLCPGDYMFYEVRHMEKLRNLPEKKLYSTGVVYYDAMVDDVDQVGDKESTAKKTILVAPTWGPHSLFVRCGLDFLDQLAKKYDLIVRPHPQIRHSQPELFEEIIERCQKLSAVVDEADSGVASMNACDMMVSDFSGIAHDYAFLYEKPLVVFDMKVDFKGYEGYYLPKLPWRIEFLPEIATILTTDQIDILPESIEETLQRNGEEIAEVRDRYIPNFGKAAPVAVDQMMEMIAQSDSQAL